MRLGTRGSALALAQARASPPRRSAATAEIVEIITSGDRDRARGRQGEWVKELERALLAGEIDLAVHSAKDVPASCPTGSRSSPRCRARTRATRSSAPRRSPSCPRARGSAPRRCAARAQLLRRAPGPRVVELRGNVDTRLRSSPAGDVDALVLAAAGLDRLGRGDEVGAPLDGVVRPRAGQGIVARRGAARAADAVVRGDQRPADAAALRAERASCARSDADCNTPVGARVADGGRLRGVRRAARRLGVDRDE